MMLTFLKIRTINLGVKRNERGGHLVLTDKRKLVDRLNKKTRHRPNLELCFVAGSHPKHLVATDLTQWIVTDICQREKSGYLNCW